MGRVVLVFALVCLLLLPPGVCVCHVFAAEKEALHGEANAPLAIGESQNHHSQSGTEIADTNVLLADEESEEDHPPGCPSIKILEGLYTTCSFVLFVPLLDFTAPLYSLGLESTLFPSSSDSQITWFLGRFKEKIPIYLTVRALLL